MNRIDDLSALPRYTYSALADPKNLRIITLRPAQSHVEYIDSELEECLPQARTYEALSWCWGEGEAAKSIRILRRGVGAYVFKVPQHLYEALCALRDFAKERYLWIDAICINQSDAEERNQQVPRMNEIYGGASNVCIWLGVEDDETEKAFKFVKERLLTFWDFDELCQDSDTAGSWIALLNLMKRDWFSRRWVVQEVSLAKRGTVHCGCHEVDWQDFADAVSLIVPAETAEKLSQLVKAKEGESDFFAEVPFLGATQLVKTTKDVSAQSAFGGYHRQRSLASLVSRLASFETSEPRDTVYALLAMARDSRPYANQLSANNDLRDLDARQYEILLKFVAYFPNPRKESYEVDYRSPIVNVYQQFIAFSIRKADPTRALDIICRPFARPYTKQHDCAFDPQKLQELTEKERKADVPLPTWIPSVTELPFGMQSTQWKRRPSDNKLVFTPQLARLRADCLVGAPEQKNYNASGTRRYNRLKLRFKKQEGQDYGYYSMFVEGFVLDFVKHRADKSQAGNIPHSWWEMVGWNDTTKPPPADAKFDDFWRTLVADRDQSGGDPPTHYPRALMKAFERGGGMQNTFNIDKWIRQGQGPIAGFLRRVKAVICERCLIETQRGRLGLAHGDVKEGDAVCILYGCSVPVIMRRRDKSEGDIKMEVQEDEAEVQRRRKKAIELVKKILAKRRARRQAKMDAALSPEERIRQMRSWRQLWEQLYSFRKVARMPFLLYLAYWVSKQGQDLAAVLLVLVAGHQLVSYANDEILELKLDWSANLIVSVAVAVLALIFPSHRLLAWETVVVILVFAFLFPRLLPNQIWRSILRTRDYFEYKIEHPPENMGGRLTVGQRLVAYLLPSKRNAKVAEEKPEPRPPYAFRLIGESYIHGMMDGEAITQFGNSMGPDKMQSEVFEIR